MRKYSDFLTLFKFKEKIRLVEEISESMNNTDTQYVSVGDFLNMHKTVLNETSLVSEIPNKCTEEKARQKHQF